MISLKATTSLILAMTKLLFINKTPLKCIFVALLFLFGCSVKEIDYGNYLYEGQVKGGKKNGEGTLSTLDGYIYNGIWKDDILFDGEVIYSKTIKNKDFNSPLYGDAWYQGTIKNGKRHGEGELRTVDKYLYKGTWRENVFIDGVIYKINDVGLETPFLEQLVVGKDRIENGLDSRFTLVKFRVDIAKTWVEAINELEQFQKLYRYSQYNNAELVSSMIKERKELIREKERKQKLENIPNDIHGLWEFLDFRGVLNYIRFIKTNDKSGIGIWKDKSIYNNGDAIIHKFEWRINEKYQLVIKWDEDTWWNDEESQIISVDNHKDKLIIENSSANFLNSTFSKVKNEQQIWHRLHCGMHAASWTRILGQYTNYEYLGDNYELYHFWDLKVLIFAGSKIVRVDAPNGDYINYEKPNWSND